MGLDILLGLADLVDFEVSGCPLSTQPHKTSAPPPPPPAYFKGNQQKSLPCRTRFSSEPRLLASGRRRGATRRGTGAGRAPACRGGAEKPTSGRGRRKRWFLCFWMAGFLLRCGGVGEVFAVFFDGCGGLRWVLVGYGRLRQIVVLVG